MPSHRIALTLFAPLPSSFLAPSSMPVRSCLLCPALPPALSYPNSHPFPVSHHIPLLFPCFLLPINALILQTTIVVPGPTARHLLCRPSSHLIPSHPQPPAIFRCSLSIALSRYFPLSLSYSDSSSPSALSYSLSLLRVLTFYFNCCLPFWYLIRVCSLYAFHSSSTFSSPPTSFSLIISSFTSHLSSPFSLIHHVFIHIFHICTLWPHPLTITSANLW